MPIFDFKCDKCQHVVEKIQNADASAPDTCEECGAQGSMRKIVGKAADFRLKGRGWHASDYGDRSKKLYSGD